MHAIKIMHSICNKPDDYLRLLNFARLNKEVDNFPSLDKGILKALDSFHARHGQLASFSMDALYPLLYHNTIKANIQNQLQPETMSKLKRTTFRLIAADVIQKKWLSKIVAIFQNNKISVILLKGTAFADSIYPESAIRPGVDLDILVREKNFDQACCLMNNMMDAVPPDRKRLATYSTLFERVFSAQSSGGPLVEIHRGLTNPHLFKINETDLWDASLKHPAFKTDRVRILSPEDTLLHLAVHAFRDLDFCTHNLVDSHEIWCQWKPRPDLLLVRAKQWKAKKVLYYLLFNCKSIMQTPIQETLLNQLEPRLIYRKINKKILNHRVGCAVNGSSMPYRFKQLISQITFTDRFWNGLIYQLIYGITRLLDWISSNKKIHNYL